MEDFGMTKTNRAKPVVFEVYLAKLGLLVIWHY